MLILKLSLNLQKTNYILFSNSVDILPGEVAFNNNPIERVTSKEILRIYIDEKLNWKTQMDKLSKVVSKNTGVIYQLRSCIPQEVLFILYSTLILSYILNCVSNSISARYVAQRACMDLYHLNT